MSRPKAGEPYTFKTPEGVLYWHPPARRGAGGGEGPGFYAEPDLNHPGSVDLGTGSHRFWAPLDFLRAVVADQDGDTIATLTRERDEACAEVAGLRAFVQGKLDEIMFGLDACSWGDDEAWQIQCHMDCLVDIINAAGGTAERVAFVVDPKEVSHG